MPEQTSVLTTRDSKKLAKISKRFEAWTQAFLDPKSETYGNATQSALKTYKTKRYFSAANIGYENVKKLENLSMYFSEQNGVNIQDWFKIATNKAVSGTYEQTMDFMQRMGIMARLASGPLVAQQFNFGDLAEKFMQDRKARGLDAKPENNIGLKEGE